MGLFSSIASGLGSVIGGPFGAVVGAAADNVLNNYNNKKAASRQNEYQWSFWNVNNDYNSPVSQMQRLEEAGLNPNLVYGNGGATHQATMATAPKVTPAQFNSLAALGVMNTFNQMAYTEAQTDIIKHNLKYAEDNKLPYGVPKTPSTVTGSALSSTFGLLTKAVSNFVADLFTGSTPGNPFYTESGLRMYDPTKPALGRNVNRDKSNFKLRFWR